MSACNLDDVVHRFAGIHYVLQHLAQQQRLGLDALQLLAPFLHVLGLPGGVLARQHPHGRLQPSLDGARPLT